MVKKWKNWISGVLFTVLYIIATIGLIKSQLTTFQNITTDDRKGSFIVNKGHITLSMDMIEQSPNEKETRVILLAYPRSGSTFTGKLLESGDPLNTSYINEPLRKFTNKLELAWQKEDYYKASKDLSSIFQSYLIESFKNQQKKVKIEKTIRLRWHHIEDWITATNIKIIHLIRDPRAMLFSMHKTGEFKRFKKHPEILCEFMLEDLEMGSKLSSSRYTKIKYSDLVSQDENTRANMTKALFEFIGIPFSKEVADNVKDFRSDNGGTGYYSVNRPADYNPDHWKDEIQQKLLTDVNKACEKTLAAMEV